MAVSAFETYNLGLTKPPRHSYRLFANANGGVLNCSSVAGKTHWLEPATNLQTGFNSTVVTNIAATAPTNTQSDMAILPGPTRFYRVGVEQ